MRGGRPYFIKGGAGLQYYPQLRAAGANSVRLWSTDYADDRLAEAHRQGLTVMLGLWLEHESKRFDYYDNEQVQEQQEQLRALVLRYRHHPALLAWNIGNELDLESANPGMFRAINDVARMIHELDPYHPVTTTLVSTLGRVPNVLRLCPDLDFLSINSFGNLLDLDERLRQQGWTGPYVVTEFGARGYWEGPRTRWQAAKEQTSTEKALFTRQRYQRTILGHPATCLGAYAFFWGNKYEYTGTWFSLFAPTGEKTATVDVMQELWSGRKPHNQAPRIAQLLLAGQEFTSDIYLAADTPYPAQVLAADPEQDALRFEWAVYPDPTVATSPEDQGFALRMATLVNPLSGVVSSTGNQATLRTPRQPGAYRLAVAVFDGQGSIATANVPFYVRPSGQR